MKKLLNSLTVVAMAALAVSCIIHFGGIGPVRVGECTEEPAPKVPTTVEDGKLTLKPGSGRYPKLILRVDMPACDDFEARVNSSGDVNLQAHIR